MAFKDISIALTNKVGIIQQLVAGLRYQEADSELSVAEQLLTELEAAMDSGNVTQRQILQHRKIDMDSLFRKVDDGLQRREAGKKADGNIAFKCNWNDKEYKGVCTDAAYAHNQLHGGPWCRHQHGRCRSFVGCHPAPAGCCYESHALTDCRFGAGWNHDQYGNMIPGGERKITSAKRGKIAVLTTVPPNTSHRLIVGAFVIDRVLDDPGQETFIIGDRDLMLDDMLTYAIKFWDFHKNPVTPKSTAWATGLFRYVSDAAVLGMLEEYIRTKGSISGDTTRAESLLHSFKATCSKQIASPDS